MTHTTCIDAHQHYWDPHRIEYFWMAPGGQLNRVYEPNDLKPTLIRNGVDGTVLIQAAPSLEETEYLLSLADKEPSVLGVVGWIDFEDPTHYAALERFRRNPKFKGVRPMIQDIADPKWVVQPNITWAFEALVEMDLCFDAQLHPQHILPFLKRLVRHPGLKAVVDHAAKPQMSEAGFVAWSVDMGRLARETQCTVKLSGLATEARSGVEANDLQHYASFLLSAFGPGRVMFGSDWPVCLRAMTYDRWFDTAEALTAACTAEERAAIFGGNALRFYGLAAPAAG